MSDEANGFVELYSPKKDTNTNKWIVCIKYDGKENFVFASKFQPSRPYITSIHNY